jgi:hypothetical protein
MEERWWRLSTALDVIEAAAGKLTEFERKLVLCRWIWDHKARLRAATADRAYESPDDVRPPPRIQPDDLDWQRSRPRRSWFVGPSAWQYGDYPARTLTSKFGTSIEGDDHAPAPALHSIA